MLEEMAVQKEKQRRDSLEAQEGLGYWLPWDPWAVAIPGILRTKDASRKQRVSAAASEWAQQVINHGVREKRCRRRRRARRASSWDDELSQGRGCIVGTQSPGTRMGLSEFRLRTLSGNAVVRKHKH